MDSFSLIFIFVSVLGCVVFCGLWYFLRKQRRAKDLAQTAEKHGFRFEGDIAVYPKDKFGSLRLFTLGNPGKMKNVLKGNKPSIWIFDYEYSIPRDQDVGQTVVMIEMPRIKLPPTVIETRKKERFTVAAMRMLTQKLANWQLSYKEVDFSIHPEFAGSYRVFCKNDPKPLKELLSAPLLDFLVQNPGWTIEIMEQWLLIYRQGQYVKPKEFETFNNFALSVYKMIEKN